MDETHLKNYMNSLGANARAAARSLRLASTETKNAALEAMARLSAAMLDRLKLDADRVASIAKGIKDIAALPDPVGQTDDSWAQPNGLNFSKVRVPIGVIGMIYESRPNVTADAGALCLKSGNACILRAGSESQNSSGAIHAALSRGLEQAGLPKDSVQLINTTDRAAVGLLLGGLDQTVDLIIPRGGKNLIARVQNDARVPVLAHLEGLCHSYIHA